MKYGIVRGAPATASVPGSKSDEDTSNHCSSSSAALYSVITNCCSLTIIICKKRKTKSIRNPPPAPFHAGGPIKRRFGSREGSSTDKTHPKGSSANKTRLKLPKLVVESFYR